MSANGSDSDQARPGREVAYRLFATEFDGSSLSYAESDEERAPNYVITPTGARLNRVFVVGTLTEVTDVNEEMVRARVVDPTGAFVVYAGQYQPEALAFLERAESPAFVAVTGKARTFEPDDGDEVYTSIRPESLATVDADTRDRWVVDTAEHTLDRIGTYAGAADLDVDETDLADVLRMNDVEDGFAEGISLARAHYGTTPTYLADLRTVATDAVRVVAGEQSQIEATVGAPDDSSPDGPEYSALAADTPDLTDPSVENAGDSEVETATVDAASGAAVGTAAASTASEASAESVLDQPSASDGPAATADDDASDEGAASAESTQEDDDATGDELGDFDTGDVNEAPNESVESGPETGQEETDDEPGEFEDSMYELDEEEREAVEEEFGTDFTTGAEVDEPGEADIDVPDPEEAIPDDRHETDDGPDEVADQAPDSETESEDADVDLQAFVVETMGELDDGNGAERSAVVETVADETGADEDDVEQAIQDALMGGECFEPSEDRLQAI